MSRGSPPVALRSRRTSCDCVVEVDRAGRRPSGCGAGTARRRGLPGASGRCGTGSGPTRTTDSCGLAGRGPRGHHHTGVGGALQHRLEHRTCLRHVEVESVEDEEALASVDGAREGSREGVAGRGLRLDALQRSDEHVVEAVQVARVDPRRGRLDRGMAHQQRLSAAGRADHGHPARLVHGLAQHALDLGTTETGGQHGLNLSPSAAEIGRTTDAGTRRFAGVFSYAEGDGTAQGTVPQPTGRLSEQVVRRRGATYDLLLRAPPRRPACCRRCVRCGHGTRPRAGRPRRAHRGRRGRGQVRQAASSWPRPRPRWRRSSGWPRRTSRPSASSCRTSTSTSPARSSTRAPTPTTSGRWTPTSPPRQPRPR